MRHAILGAGGVGGFIGGALARAGQEVVLLLRPEAVAKHPATLRVESVRLGDFEVEVSTTSMLDREVDVLWVTPKAPQLASALELAPAERVGEAIVVPLLNGVDHVALLRERYEHVLPAAIWVESERPKPGLIREKTELGRVDLAPGARRDEIAAELRAAGLDVSEAPDEATLLWGKLAVLAPLALATTALGAPVGAVQSDPEWLRRLLECHDEAVRVALGESAALDPEQLRRIFDYPHGELRTSMQKDFDAGRSLELDAIAGPIVRGGQRHGIPTSTTKELVRLVEARLAARL
jgi:2-dehydropantoate 2-reductase